MRAIHLTDFVQSYADLSVTARPDPVPTPAAPLLVRITHAGINYVDLLYVRGRHQNNKRHVRPPFVPGLEFAGVVVAAPPRSHYPPGTAVFGSAGTGAFATLIAVPESAVQAVPEQWSPRAAAGVAATAPVAYGALVRVAAVQKGEWVLVHAGAGGLGGMAVQIAAALGARVVATVGSERKAAVARALGAQHAVLYTRDGWEAEVTRLADGKGAHVVFDPVGLVVKSIRCARYRARVVVVGFAGRGEGDMELVPANRVLLKSIQLLGYRYGEHGRQLGPEETQAAWDGVAALMRAGKVKPVVYDDDVFEGLESVPRALQAMADRRVWGKAVVDVQPAAAADDDDAAPKL